MGLADDLGIDPTDASTWPTHCPTCSVELPRTRQCMRHKRDGGHCGRSAAPGAVVCVKHGARAPQVKAAADRRVAEAEARRTIETAIARMPRQTLGVPVPVDPAEALLGSLYRLAAWAGVLHGLLSDVDADQLTQYGAVGREQSVYVRMYLDVERQLAAAATACLRADIDRRQVELAEAQGRLLAEAFRSFALALDLDPAEDRVRTAMRASLMLVQGGAAA